MVGCLTFGCLVKKIRFIELLLFVSIIVVCYGLDNGVALTPPMGWSSWNTFKCNITESLILNHATTIVSSGMRDVGYQYVNIDDCWMAPRRDKFGNLQADSQKFPNGMKYLADRLHSMGLKLGIYTCPGEKTCLGFPGSYEHEYNDARLFASWGVDFVKYDNCFLHYVMRDIWVEQVYNCSCNNFTYYLEMQDVDGIGSFVPNVGGDIDIMDAYALMGEALLSTGRPIVYSICPLTSGCNISTARYYIDVSNMCMNQCPQHDAEDNWNDFLLRIDSFVKLGVGILTQPGYFTDLDMLEVGNGGETLAEYRSWMSLYAIFASPIIAGNDLTTMKPEIQEILTSPEIIKVNQDSLAKAGTLVNKQITPFGDLDVYSRPLFGGSYAVGLLNRSNTTQKITLKWSYLGFPPTAVCLVRDLWKQQDIGYMTNSYTASVDSHDTAMVSITYIPV